MTLKVDYLPVGLTNDLPTGKKGKTNDSRPFLCAKGITECHETGQFMFIFRTPLKRLVCKNILVNPLLSVAQT
jgi:hypothetical protein